MHSFSVLPSSFPDPRQPIHRLSLWLLLLESSFSIAVYGGHLLPKGELRGSYPVPGFRFTQTLEWHSPPGLVEVKTGRGEMRQLLSLSILDQALRSALRACSRLRRFKCAFAFATHGLPANGEFPSRTPDTPYFTHACSFRIVRSDPVGDAFPCSPQGLGIEPRLSPNIEYRVVQASFNCRRNLFFWLDLPS